MSGLRHIMDEAEYLEIHGPRDGTTSFMRSLDEFPQVEKIFTEDLLEKKDKPFEIAIVGCSSGMEAYSYAMVCETNGFSNYRVDGYDVDSEKLEEGRDGWYPIFWMTQPALIDARIKKGLARKDVKELELQDGSSFDAEGIAIDDVIVNNTKFFEHDISLQPLPSLYDVIVCTNVLAQPQRGGREEAMNNLVMSVRQDGLIIQNYGYFRVADKLKSRVNLELQEALRLPVSSYY